MNARPRIAAAAVAVLAAAAVALAPGTARAAGCAVQLGDQCGPYYVPGVWQGSNGHNTYASNQPVDVQSGGAETLAAPDPSAGVITPVTITARLGPPGWTGVQAFPDIQQLMNNWSPARRNWTGGQDTPVGALTGLRARYSVKVPRGGAVFEFGLDVWSSYAGQLGGGTGDIMFWAYTSRRRCTDNGLSAADILGTAGLGGVRWTAYRYGPAGGEIVFIRDTTSRDPVSTGTCARRRFGTVHVLAGLRWLISRGFINAGSLPLMLGQLNAGFEVCSAAGGVFRIGSYSVAATVRSRVAVPHVIVFGD